VSGLEEADLHIWYRSTAALDLDAMRLADQHLSIEERARRDRFHFEADRRDFTIAHDLLRRALSRYADVPPPDWKFATNDYGKLSIESSDPKVRALSFSLSHTRGCAACAITARASIGIDVERIDQSRPAQEIADQYFTPKEAAQLRECSDKPRNTRFAELWTLKEAFLKALGVGLSGSLSSVSFRLDEHAGIEFSGSSTFEPKDWHFALFEPIHNMRLAVAIGGVARPLVLMRDDQGDGRTFTPIRSTISLAKNI